MLEDDIKEYWGFYLIKGSIVRLSVCSRHEGAGVIVVKGLKDARRCSFLGELDSEEESDEISEEFEFSHELVNISPDKILKMEGESLNAQQVFVKDHIKELNALSRDQLVKRYLSLVKKLEPKVSDELNPFQAFKVRDAAEAETALEKSIKPVNLEDEVIDYPIGAGVEEIDVYDLIHQGQFNQKNKNGLDKSNEEVRSSWSSSEEAAAFMASIQG